jgi:hypothetical protein
MLTQQQRIDLVPAQNGGRLHVTPHSLQLLQGLNPQPQHSTEQPSEQALAQYTTTKFGGPSSPTGAGHQLLLSCLAKGDLDVELPAGTQIRVILEGCKPRPDEPFANSLIQGLKPRHCCFDLPLHGAVRPANAKVNAIQSILVTDKVKVKHWNDFWEHLRLPDAM